MANAKVENREVQKVVTTDEKVYALELNEHEAKVLFALSGQISGTGEVRTVMSEIYYALKSTGVAKGTVVRDDLRYSVDMHNAKVVPGLVWR